MTLPITDPKYLYRPFVSLTFRRSDCDGLIPPGPPSWHVEAFGWDWIVLRCKKTRECRARTFESQDAMWAAVAEWRRDELRLRGKQGKRGGP